VQQKKCDDRIWQHI